MEEGDDDVTKIDKIDGPTMAFLIKHLEAHDYNPPGVHNKSYPPDLSKNIGAVDFQHVKDLGGMDHFEEVAKFAQACHFLGIEKLKKVYLAIILTEYTLEGRTIADLNKKFKSKFSDPKWETYEELTEERMDELKKLFPFMDKKGGEGKVEPEVIPVVLPEEPKEAENAKEEEHVEDVKVEGGAPEEQPKVEEEAPQEEVK